MLRLPAWALQVVDLWLRCRRYGAASLLGGAGTPALPCGGAVGEQPAALMDGFDMLDAWASQKDGEGS